jgi:hypothetical protein
MNRHGIPAAALVILGLSGWYCAAASPRAEQPGGSVAARTAELREANYAADAEATARLLADFRSLAADARQGDRAMAHYQAATASSFLAGFVGPGSLANPKGDVPRMLRHMEEAAKDHEAAIALAPEFPETHAALANIYGYRTAFEPGRAAELTARAQRLRERALALAPRNPRVVAGHAGFLFWAPPQAGGNRELGLARYRESIALFQAEEASERELHAWGEPDVWAFLAMAQLALDPPDPIGARSAVDRALALRPDFAWARGYLLPRIEQALSGGSPAPTSPAGGASPKRNARR